MFEKRHKQESLDVLLYMQPSKDEFWSSEVQRRLGWTKEKTGEGASTDGP